MFDKIKTKKNYFPITNDEYILFYLFINNFKFNILIYMYKYNVSTDIYELKLLNYDYYINKFFFNKTLNKNHNTNTYDIDITEIYNKNILFIALIYYIHNNNINYDIFDLFNIVSRYKLIGSIINLSQTNIFNKYKQFITKLKIIRNRIMKERINILIDKNNLVKTYNKLVEKIELEVLETEKLEIQINALRNNIENIDTKLLEIDTIIETCKKIQENKETNEENITKLEEQINDIFKINDIKLSENHIVIHSICGFICDGEYYIFDSNSYFTKLDWRYINNILNDNNIKLSYNIIITYVLLYKKI
jgi:hypothetical protein